MDFAQCAICQELFEFKNDDIVAGFCILFISSYCCHPVDKALQFLMRSCVCICKKMCEYVQMHRNGVQCVCVSDMCA